MTSKAYSRTNSDQNLVDFPNERTGKPSIVCKSVAQILVIFHPFSATTDYSVYDDIYIYIHMVYIYMVYIWYIYIYRYIYIYIHMVYIWYIYIQL